MKGDFAIYALQGRGASRGPVVDARAPIELPADGQFATHTELFDLTGKYALVTGGTRGIGMMMARGLVQAGECAEA